MTRRQLTIATLLTWPVGLLLVALNVEVPAMPAPVYVALTVVYAAGVLALLRSWDVHQDRTAAALVLVAPALFALVGFPGPPTADEPQLMLLNTAALMVVALALLLVAVRIVTDHRASHHLPAAMGGLVLLVIGSTLYLANLVARLAVVLAGLADRQAAPTT